MFSGLKSHNHPSCSVHQTSSDIQVLCQHDLKRKNVLMHHVTQTEQNVSYIQQVQYCIWPLVGTEIILWIMVKPELPL